MSKPLRMDDEDMTLLMTPAEDMEHLHAWIDYFLGLDFPDKVISRHSNASPMMFIWDAYSAMIEGRPHAALALAGRESLKTLGVSVLDLLAFLHDQRAAAHLGMTKAQGMRARAYLEQFINKIPALRASIVKQNNTELRMAVGDKEIGIEILPCTPKAVQGAHVSFLSFDELASSMEPNNIKGYKDAHGIVGTSDNGKPGVIVKITSRQTGASIAEQELKNAEKSGIKIYRWTTLDATERCPDSRSGTKPKPLWISVHRGESYTEQQYPILPPEKREGLVLESNTFEKCEKCPIVTLCAGDLKHQTSNSKLLRKIDDVIAKVRLNGSHDWALAQIMSLKPAQEGLVFWEFDRKIHVPGWDAMWEVLTGSPPTSPVTRATFVAQLKKQGAQFYAGQDFGWTHPAATVVIAVDRSDNVYVIDTMTKVKHSEPEIANLVALNLMPKYDLEMIAPDVASPGGIHEFKKAGLPVTDKVVKDIMPGISLIKGFLRVPSMGNRTKMFFAPDLEGNTESDSGANKVPGLIEEMESYKFEEDAAGRMSDTPMDLFNHHIDALRYILMWLYGRSKARSSLDEAFDAANKTAPFTMTEIARAQGIAFEDNRDQFSKMGKQDPKPEGDDPGGNGGHSPAGFSFGWG